MMVGNMLTLGNSVVAFLQGDDDSSDNLFPDPIFYVLLLLAFMG
eukprot:CAMPEP_0179166248 /NCGR_PEP_ID=MMETSP0796-20121207/81672_1 /TAXON_ID=73915 /ORGANISM="Pyrodinium bahamense, Strain pbaha01" /LENGTH=43 /DNA_ID= /DNA_START= /DNA_END= /DNA_ORIENTATION=